MKRTFILSIALIIYSSIAYGQIGLHPQVVFLDAENRSTNLLVMNTAEEEKEITVNLEFGFPGYDSLGNMVFYQGDTLPEAKYSAAPFVKFFPKKLLLKSKEEQIVRIMLGNTTSLEDGTYYCRILVTSKNPPAEIDTTYTETISAKLDVHFTLVSALIVQKGKRDCKLSISNPKVTSDTANVNFIFDIAREGNSPFFGTSYIEISEPDGEVVIEKKELTPIYFTCTRAYKFDKTKFTSGKYRVELTMSNEHKDIPDDFKTPIEPIKSTVFLDVVLDK